MHELVIRAETPAEYPAIYALVREAFRTAPAADGDEQDFVVQLRAGENYIPELALVAVLDGKLAGHIMLTRTAIDYAGGQRDALLLAPLCVAPEYRNRSVGGALIETACARAAEMGHKAVFLVGDPGYYGRFGFAPCAAFGVGYAMDIPPENVMALELEAGYIRPGGRIDIV
jgi:predicted N-acetyltransferase YhbS